MYYICVKLRAMIVIFKIELFAISTSLIIHLLCPKKICISVVFIVSWDDCNTQGKWETKVMQNFGGQTRCIMGNVEMANSPVLHCASLLRIIYSVISERSCTRTLKTWRNCLDIEFCQLKNGHGHPTFFSSHCSQLIISSA